MKENGVHYLAMPQPPLTDGGMTMRTVQPQDIEAIRQWRNAQMDVLRQSAPISPQQQIDYYATHIWPELTLPQPSNLLVGLLRDHQLIGYGGLVHISWQHSRAEVSILFAPERAADDRTYSADLSTYFRLIKRLAFEHLKLHRLVTETYDIRPRHVSIMEANGFEPEGRLRDHVWINDRPVDSLLHGCLNPNDRQSTHG